MPQPLPPKEASHFRAVIRCYEDKQYKRGLKTAELILKKIPKHGDTMAMKALILNAQGKSEEAFALGKEALTVDMKSHICWHVYGLLYRTNKNFEEAIKAYKFALRLEPESPQIQRDLAILQVQMRDHAGFIQSRTSMLQARPQVRQSWSALAVAHHLAGNLADAENVLTTYEGTLKSTPSKYDIEHSEAIMYKNTLIAEQGDYQRALEHLDSIAKTSLDRLAVLESRAEYLTKLERKSEAAKIYRTLIDRNPERPTYYAKLLEALEIPETDLKARKAIFDEYSEKLPRCDAARRLPLDFLNGRPAQALYLRNDRDVDHSTGDEFKEAAQSYLTLMLNKGVPSTFANLKHLYNDEFKKETLAVLATEYLNSPNASDSSTDKGEAAALYYLAQHYNYHLSRDLEKATNYIEKAIEKDAKSVDFHMAKARILKHTGNLKKAAEVMDFARTLDLKDRYINSKCAKYQLRNDENDKALKTVGLFTRADTVGGPFADLLDMQCIWFLTEDGESYARQGNLGLALKRFHAIAHIFDVWQDDQFDFHSFSLRKGQIRAYIDTLRWEDHLRDHPFFSRAALDAIKLYLSMADGPATNGVNGADGEDSEDALARKKAAKKARKEQQRLEREAAEKQAKQDPNKTTQAADAKKKDDDPFGLKLAATTDPLGDAMKFLGPLLQAGPKNIDAQVAGFDVYLRRKKYLLALRCLNAARAIDPQHPRVHEQTVQFRHTLKSNADLAAKVSEVVKHEFRDPDEATDLRKYNEEYQKKDLSDTRRLISAIKVKRLLGEDQGACERELLELGEGGSFEDGIEILDTLKSWRSSGVSKFRELARSKWPEVTRLA
ncbi:hypothetical protein S7711_08981 [Stachybotrys chartarum IBT 7711]|uniref:Uncharacterized protein n=1 Tax=Stachybotrys chartarum (strain CBS 109288 / IBT 7711) TaxID=1280523 RepID=A0A084AX12_STACB|nr:hypothetical protein S7711_08981 [Stachybotrys chartarum IBT 7711]KFA47617.1 hypothetical protein S40293_07662 [Stachybotrys chartarum IBT 40293]